MTMNERANRLVDDLEAHAEQYRVAVSRVGGARVIDCGGAVDGSLNAGVRMAEVCLGGLGQVSLVASPLGELAGPAVQVHSDDPVRACLASQYAGWQVKAEKFFAMGSGPMRAAYAREEIYQHIPGQESPSVAVGVLEGKRHPTEEVIAYLVGRLPTTVEKLSLLIAPASSLAGSIQVVARSVETALHKLHELKFDVRQVVSGFGIAPLPPVARDEIAAIGRTNDAILYGGQVTLWVRTDDEIIEAIGPQVPSSASRDYGSLFAELFARYGDFYKIDPLLFSPAQVTFVNLKTGRAFQYGRVDTSLLRRSFYGA